MLTVAWLTWRRCSGCVSGGVPCPEGGQPHVVRAADGRGGERVGARLPAPGVPVPPRITGGHGCRRNGPGWRQLPGSSAHPRHRRLHRHCPHHQVHLTAGPVLDGVLCSSYTLNLLGFRPAWIQAHRGLKPSPASRSIAGCYSCVHPPAGRDSRTSSPTLSGAVCQAERT